MSLHCILITRIRRTEETRGNELSIFKVFIFICYIAAISVATLKYFKVDKEYQLSGLIRTNIDNKTLDLL